MEGNKMESMEGKDMKAVTEGKKKIFPNCALRVSLMDLISSKF